MRISEMKAKDGSREVRIFVSQLMKNDGCDDFRTHRGWWYCVVGGQVGYFTTHRPTSGCQLRGKVEECEHDIFNINGTIDTKEQFAELLSM